MGTNGSTAEKPFVMKLSSSPENIAITGERLRSEFGAEVVIVTRGNKSRLTAHVPQQHARAAMALLGLP